MDTTKRTYQSVCGCFAVTIVLAIMVAIVAIILTAKYTDLERDRKYIHWDICYIQNTYVTDVTDGKCPVRSCYRGVWNLTTVYCVAQIFTDTFDTVRAANAMLQTRNGTQWCYSDGDCGYSWSKDRWHDNLYLAMIFVWTLFGVMLICCTAAAMLTRAALISYRAEKARAACAL